MRRPIAIASAALVALVTVGSVGAATVWKPSPFQAIGVYQVVLDNDHLAGAQVIDAFVPSGSSSSNCLATLSETNQAPFPTSVFCSSRTQTVDGKLISGVRLYIYYPEPVPVDYGLAVNIYQEGAKSYGSPVLYTGS